MPAIRGFVVVTLLAAIVRANIIPIGDGNVVLEVDSVSCTSTLVVTREGVTERGTAVPFIQLYNRVSDALPQNLETCTGVTVLAESNPTSGVLDVHAAHGYGTVRMSYTVKNSSSFAAPSASTFRVFFVVTNTSQWTADPVEKHLAFGQFWTGLIEADKAPTVMGKVQGAVALPLTNEATSGFVTISSRSYFRYIFYAEPNDELAFGWVDAPGRPEQLWQAVASDKGIAPPSSNRHHTWLWAMDFNEESSTQYIEIGKALGIDVLMATGWDTLYLTVSNESFPSGIAKTVAALEKSGLHLGLHMHPDIVWPCATGEDLSCLSSGIGNSPVVLECPECVIPEGLAPTYRSGDLENLARSPTEDLGFWWGHDKTGSTAFGGNMQPCGQGSCNARDWNFTWVPNMTLVQAGWSKVGRYRNGGAVLFGGNSTSYGMIPGWDVFDAARSGITVGLVAHPLPQGSLLSRDLTTQCLFERAGSYSVCLDGNNRVLWTVNTTSGKALVCEGKRALIPSDLSSYVVRTSFNGSAGTAHIFIDGTLDTSCQLDAKLSPAVVSDAAHGEPILVGRGFWGALEEIYIKNVSTEHRVGYLYADNNRVLGTYLLDLSRPAGQAYFAKTVSTAINTATPVAVQYDGFEKMALIAGQDFAHSPKTWTSGLYRGNPTPDWYHFEGWPLRWGLGVLQAMTAAHEATMLDTAVEASFMAPGLGPWRPDMAPYVDERGDLVDLGLEWHPKILFRTQITGTVVNAYDTSLSKITSDFDVDYWFGGLVATGIPPQPMMGSPSTWSAYSKYAARIKGWMQRYNRYGFATEGAVTTLVYDSQCCHIQGICEWIACRDAVAVVLSGGNNTSALGLYIGTNDSVAVPQGLSASRDVHLFQAKGTLANISVGGKADPELKVRVLSPVSPSNIHFTGSWWDLENENVRETLSAEDGTILSTRLLFSSPVSGPQMYSFVKTQSTSWRPGCLVTLSKEKSYAF